MMSILTNLLIRPWPLEHDRGKMRIKRMSLFTLDCVQIGSLQYRTAEAIIPYSKQKKFTDLMI
jgi:hypothetical protein